MPNDKCTSPANSSHRTSNIEKFKLQAEGTLIEFGFIDEISFADVTSQTEVEYSILS